MRRQKTLKLLKYLFRGLKSEKKGTSRWACGGKCANSRALRQKVHSCRTQDAGRVKLRVAEVSLFFSFLWQALSSRQKVRVWRGFFVTRLQAGGTDVSVALNSRLYCVTRASSCTSVKKADHGRGLQTSLECNLTSHPSLCHRPRHHRLERTSRLKIIPTVLLDNRIDSTRLPLGSAFSPSPSAPRFAAFELK